ncbi:MAG: outer membrane lipoprotein chaperone LolA [Serpentinimonas sp.]|nr:outer membrane lipoprotein chaperone LolA [Serpentinimonas sp.]
MLAAVLLSAVFMAPRAHADGLAALESFLRNTQHGQARFTQTVTSPVRDGETTARSKTSSGTFEFQRPNRFRFDYQKPFPQTIVADGETLWLYDPDLNQVTTRKQADALGNTPAALIASSADLRRLREVFDLSNASAPASAGAGTGWPLDVVWVEARPRQRDGQLQAVRIGLQAGTLVALDILDSFGQRSLLRFEPMAGSQAAPPGAERFRFTPPAGADVLRQ